jgi:hypothetical protein
MITNGDYTSTLGCFQQYNIQIILLGNTSVDKKGMMRDRQRDEKKATCIY